MTKTEERVRLIGAVILVIVLGALVIANILNPQPFQL